MPPSFKIGSLQSWLETLWAKMEKKKSCSTKTLFWKASINATETLAGHQGKTGAAALGTGIRRHHSILSLRLCSFGSWRWNSSRSPKAAVQFNEKPQWCHHVNLDWRRHTPLRFPFPVDEPPFRLRHHFVNNTCTKILFAKHTRKTGEMGPIARRRPSTTNWNCLVRQWYSQKWSQ